MEEGAAWLLGVAARELVLFAAAGLLIGGVDDLAMDLVWLARGCWRRWFVFTRHERATLATLPPPNAPGLLAVFIPAWKEEAVIGRMLAAAVAGIVHDDYRLYVGTYPNDPATVRAVRAVNSDRVRLVGGVLPGPTTKAECLNRMWHAMLADEEMSGRRVKAVILHDAEDVIHAGELALYDRMIERFDFVQVPVRPLPVRPSFGARAASPTWRDHLFGWWRRSVSSTYMDEFAEAHGKQLCVREALGAGIPAAGVGCAISRDVLARLAEAAGGMPFDAGSVTEDYEIGLRMKAMGARAAFVALPMRAGERPIAVEAHFPDTVRTAVRQKARWMQGIALAGWDRLRWQGGLAERWMRLRDRRGVLAAIVLAAAYAGGVLALLCRLLGIVPAWPVSAAPLFAATTALLVWRLALRAWLVAGIHGWREGLLAIPRVLLSNLIAMAAARRALAIYVPGVTPAWDKTAHAFPEAHACD